MTTGPASIPATRVRSINSNSIRRDGRYVLYWMIGQRRTRWNYSLQHALQRAANLDRPLFVLEALREDYPWASARFHGFVIEGMADNATAFASAGVRYFPYVESEPNSGSGLLEHLAARASLVVTDDFPCFFLPRMVTAAAQKVSVLMEAVDANGIVPLGTTPKAFTTAHSFRRWLQKELPTHLAEQPVAEPLAGSTETPVALPRGCLLYTSPSPRDRTRSRMPSSA